MLISLALAALALRAGLAMRRRRRRSEPRERGLLARHVRFARPAVVMLLVGFVGGPLSASFLRDWTPFATLHGWLGITAAALFAVAGWLGLQLERGGSRDRARAAERHGLLATLAMLAGGIAAVAGMVLLP